MTISISEENDKELLESWFKGREPDLQAFIKKVSEEYNHDYGTVCYAVAAIAYQSAMWAARNFGITGFQAGAVKWIFLRHWDDLGEYKPKKMVDYSNMLYPQYEDNFQNSITESTWKWLQEEAKKKIDALSPEEIVSQKVYDHWHSIVDGVVPFGYWVKKDD